MTSLIDNMYELKCDFAIITETWFKGGKKLLGELSDVEQASGIKLICKNRTARAMRGGGVAVAFNAARCNLKKKQIKTKHEIVCVVGKIGKIERQFAIFSVYVPPRTKAAEFTELCEDLAAALILVKTSTKDPIIIVGGDFNNRDPTQAFEPVGGLDKVSSGPTRGDATLDLVFTNARAFLVGGTALTFPPLESEDGLRSDHRTVWASLKFKKERDFSWVKVKVRLRSDMRERAFKQSLSLLDWEPLEGLGLDEAVEEFEKRIGALTDQHFPYKTFRRRSNEKPWITNGIRKRSRRKRMIFRKRGRSASWRELSKNLEEEVRVSKEAFVDAAIERGGNGREFYSVVKKLSGPSGPSTWSVRDLFPGVPDEDVCKIVTDYFSSVGGKEEGRAMPALEKVPVGITFTVDKVVELLGNLKKKDSHVPGDPLPFLVRGMPDLFAPPITTIFNKACAEGSWPSSWKTEFLTIIPKVKNPSGLDETRNISCTALFSKVLEGAFLEQLRSELQPDPEQYGGLRACGAEHMLVDLWEAALVALDEGKEAVALLGVDFQKAFNRMDFASCIEELRRLGASAGSLCMVKSFLEDRRMKMRLGNASSDLVAILRGSPQGSVLGPLLYCATTQRLVGRGPAFAPRPGGEETGQDDVFSNAEELPDDLGDRPSVAETFRSGVPERAGDVVRFFPSDPDESDVSEESVRFWESVEPVVGSREAERDLGTKKYIDDTTLVQAVALESSTKHFTTNTTVETLQLDGLGDRLEVLIKRAREIGMVINCKKTQLLVLSPANGCKTIAYLPTPEGQVSSVDKFKLVGFMFGNTPDVTAHFEMLVDKFRVKVWLLFHLREAGISGVRLFRLYCVYIRSVLEYCSPVYHSMLTRGQAESLERLQRHAGRICFGNGRAVEDFFQENGVETLEERRIARIDKFIKKSVADWRFGPSWFPRRQAPEYGLRERRTFVEPQVKTMRLFNSPRNFFIRRANELGLS